MTSFLADLHLHSRFSRACSTDITIENLERFARKKGIDILGTGDFQHPEWNKEIKENLKENQDGILETKSGFKFLLSTELSFIYTQGGKGRRIHLVVFAPNLKTVDKIIEYLSTKGRLDYDGRPIFNMSIEQATGELLNISKEIEIIPAHIWTPWFGVFGSMSGFNSLKEAFGSQSENIHAIETGLSSDPPMNWRVKELDTRQILSFSDAHSFWPWRLGREMTKFQGPITYKNIITAIKTSTNLWGTIEVDPSYGKYHYDGHRLCKFSCPPSESRQMNNTCPVCKRSLTIGVLNRVEELADRKEGGKPTRTKEFISLIPLHEIISGIIGKGIATKATQSVADKIMHNRNEMQVLIELTEQELMQTGYKDIARAILEVRKGDVTFKPGYDGEYGIPSFQKQKFSDDPEPPGKTKIIAPPEQSSLDKFM
ncbi:DNA helicase UvrD [Candidatus Woesearchaeota archaeon]|nr:DNA helicase UvrD [Candidatus Woesearchaeota archaeon]